MKSSISELNHGKEESLTRECADSFDDHLAYLVVNGDGLGQIHGTSKRRRSWFLCRSRIPAHQAAPDTILAMIESNPAHFIVTAVSL